MRFFYQIYNINDDLNANFPVDWYFRMIEGITDPGSSSHKSELIARQFTGYFIFISFFRADCNMQISDYKDEIKSI